MKTTRLLLIALMATGVSCAAVHAQQSAATPAPAAPAPRKSDVETTNSDDPAKLSEGTSKLVTAGLPKFNPNKPEEKPRQAPNPDVLELEKMTITNQRPRPRLTPQVMITRQGFNEQLAKERLSTLDRTVLNRFALPSWFGGKSAADRAREEFEREKNATMRSDVNALAQAVEVDNPEQAKALREAVNK